MRSKNAKKMCTNLIDNSVSSTARVSSGTASRLGDTVERRRPGLVEYVANVGLKLSEPHRQQLGASDGDEVGLDNNVVKKLLMIFLI